jgi:hypothetical protein
MIVSGSQLTVPVSFITEGNLMRVHRVSRPCALLLVVAASLLGASCATNAFAADTFTPMFWVEDTSELGPAGIDTLYEIVLYRWETLALYPGMNDSIAALQSAGYDVYTYIPFCYFRDRGTVMTDPIKGAMGDTATGGYINATLDGWRCRDWDGAAPPPAYYIDPRQSAIRDALVDSHAMLVERADYTPDGFIADHLMDSFYTRYCNAGSAFDPDSARAFRAGYRTAARAFAESLEANIDGIFFFNGTHTDTLVHRAFESFPEDTRDNSETYGKVNRRGFALAADYRGLDVALFGEKGIMQSEWERIALLPLNGGWVTRDIADYDIVVAAAFANSYAPGPNTVIQCGEVSKDHTALVENVVAAMETTSLWPRAGYFVSGEPVPTELPGPYEVIVVPWNSLGADVANAQNAQALQAEGLEVYVNIPIAFLDPNGTSDYHDDLLPILGDTTDGEWLKKHTGSTVPVRYSSMVDSTNLKWIDPRDEVARNALIAAHAAIINDAVWQPDGFFFDRIYDEIDWIVDQDLDPKSTAAYDLEYKTAIHALAKGIKDAIADTTSIVYGNGEHTCTDMDGMVLWNFPTTREWQHYTAGATRHIITRVDEMLLGPYGKDNWDTVAEPPMIVPLGNYTMEPVPDAGDEIPGEVVVEAVAFGHTFAPNSIIFDNEAFVDDAVRMLYGYECTSPRTTGKWASSLRLLMRCWRCLLAATRL